MKIANRLLITLSLGVAISACQSTPNRAPVIERNPTEPMTNIQKPQAEKSVTPSKTNIETRQNYVVKRGDTLIRIALEHGQNYSDLVQWNNLKNPNDIKVDQVLWVAPEVSTTTVVKTTPIQTNSGVEQRSLSAVNAANNKTTPKGDKRPYSDLALAELQKSDANPTNVGNSTAIVAKQELVSAKQNEKSENSVAVEQNALDWGWPIDGKVVTSFDDLKNKGIDFSGRLGQDIFAAASGKVSYEGGAIRGYGNAVIIAHGNNYLSVYAHNKVNLVKEGQMVSKGQKIAEMGSSDSESVKLHFEIRKAGKPVDPIKHLPNR
jgi:lipoprotein NlpD